MNAAIASIFRANYLSVLRKEGVHFFHDGEGIGNIEDIGLAAGPSTIRIEADRPAFADKPPADSMRLLAVAAGREAFRVARGGTGLADLVHMSEKREGRLTFAAQIDKRLRAAER